MPAPCTTSEAGWTSRSSTTPDQDAKQLPDFSVSNLESSRAIEGDLKSEQTHPVDEGWAWMVMLGACICGFVAAGAMKSFGVLYVEFLDLYQKTPSQLGVLTFTQVALYGATAPFAGYLNDHVDMRPVLIISSLVSAACMVTMGMVSNFKVAVVMYGIGVGVCAGIAEVVMYSNLAKHFHKKTTLAHALVYTSASLGTGVQPVLMRWLIDQYTVRGALQLLAGMWLHIAVGASLHTPESFYKRTRVRQRTQSGGGKQITAETSSKIVDSFDKSNIEDRTTEEDVSQSSERGEYASARHEFGVPFREGKTVDKSPKCSNGIARAARETLREYWVILKNPQTLLLSVAILLSSFSHYGMLMLVPAYSEQELGFSKMGGSMLLLMLSLAEIISRTPLTLLVSRFKIDLEFLTTGTLLISGVVGTLTFYINTPWMMYLWSATAGVFEGFWLVLAMPLYLSVIKTEDAGKAAALYLCSFSAGYGMTLPVLGAIQEVTGTYTWSMRVAAFGLFAACFFLVLRMRWTKRSWPCQQGPRGRDRDRRRSSQVSMISDTVPMETVVTLYHWRRLVM